MRIATFLTPHGPIEVNDSMTDKELAKFGVKDKALAFPESEIDKLEKRIEALEAKEK